MVTSFILGTCLRKLEKDYDLRGKGMEFEHVMHCNHSASLMLLVSIGP